MQTCKLSRYHIRIIIELAVKKASLSYTQRIRKMSQVDSEKKRIFLQLMPWSHLLSFNCPVIQFIFCHIKVVSTVSRIFHNIFTEGTNKVKSRKISLIIGGIDSTIASCMNYLSGSVQVPIYSKCVQCMLNRIRVRTYLRFLCFDDLRVRCIRSHFFFYNVSR